MCKIRCPSPSFLVSLPRLSQRDLPGISGYFSRRKWAGWATIGLGGLPYPLRLFRLGEDIDFAISVVRAIGGELGTLTAIIASPLFGIGLIAYGVAHLLFIGEPKRALRHPAWGYVGWTIFGLCLSAVMITVGWGAIQAYIQARVSHEIETQQPADRVLLPEQVNNLFRVFRPLASSFPSLQVQSVSASPDAAGYAQQFMGVFHLAGMTVNGIAPDNNQAMPFPSPAQVSSSKVRGLLIGVSGTPLPDRASQFQAALREAGFEASFIRWNGIGSDDFVFVVSYR
jgi:hypothetical protein